MPNDTDVSELKSLLAKKAFKRCHRVLLNGEESSYFIEVKNVGLSAYGGRLIGQVLAHRIVELALNVRAIGGSERSTAIIVATLIASYPAINFEGFVLLKKRMRLHGEETRIQGYHQKGPVLILEDVTTTGQSTVELVQKVQSAGLRVQAVLSLIDREEGAAGQIRPICPFYSMYSASELFEERTRVSV